MKKFLCLLLSVITLVSTFANPVDPNTAKTIGYNFLSSKIVATNLGTADKLKLTYTSVAKDGTASFYAFSLSNGKGFVLVSANDAVEPILGYSTESSFDLNTIKKAPVQITNWLNNYSKKIAYAIAHKATATNAIKNRWELYQTPQTISKHQLFGAPTGVSPLVQTTWDQSTEYTGAPYTYNALCPYDSNYNDRAVTGCVATAMAQIMRYWNYPATGSGSNSYTPQTNYYLGVQSANFGATTYQWNNMPLSLTTSSPAADINAVATLMYQCGVSVDMNYGVGSGGGSSAIAINNGGGFWGTAYNNAQEAFVNNFNYDISLQGLNRSSYTDAAWIGLIEKELNAKRPVIYTGDGSDGGHCWVGDGYDANNYIHFNWGWSGACNGYYDIDNLNPSALGGANFDVEQQAIIGIKPRITYSKPANQSDSLALVTLYNSTGGSNWTNHTGWLTTPVRNWYGIQLDSTGRVYDIQLSNNNLTGTIPNALSTLSNLQDLELNGNQLSGNVPLSLASLSKLTYFDLTNNNFTFAGTEPVGLNFNNNPNLQVNYAPQSNIPLYQSGNKLWVSVGGSTNAVSYYWFVNGNLITTVYGDSTFTPTIPGAYTVEAYDSLIGMYLISNTDTASLYVPANTTDSLAMVDFYNSTNGPNWANHQGWLQAPFGLWNGITIDATGRVTTINLFDNDLQGIVPSSFSNLTNLTYLELGNNRLTGGFTLSTSASQNLTYANLAYNYFTFGGLEPLQTQLNADSALQYGYKFTYTPQDTIIPIHRSGSKLWVSMGGTPSSINYTWYFNGAAVGIINGDSTFTATASGIYQVQANDTALGLFTLTSDTLTVGGVFVAANKTDSLALVALYNSTAGKNWNYNTNWLQGPVSSWYGVYLDATGRVKSLGLYGNNLVGTIPSTLGNITNVTFLDLYNNTITGIIPTTFTKLTNLNFLELGSNQLSGSIPAALGTFSNLTFLDVSNNSFNFTNLEPISLIVTSSGNSSLSFYYSPQANIPLTVKGTQLSVNMGGTASVVNYNWYLNDLNINGGVGANSQTASSPGVYFATATDSLVSNLTLYSTLDTVIVKANVSDSLALVALYNATGGSNWTYNTGWLQSPVSIWPGVILNSSGRVTDLVLYQNNLNGSVPSSLNNLTQLSILELGANQLSGTLPLTYNFLNSLSYLDISGNNYTFTALEPVVNDLASNSNIQFSYSPQNNIPLYQSGDTLSVTVGGTPSNISYQWYYITDTSSVLAATVAVDSSYTPTVPGSYYVVATDASIASFSLISNTIVVTPASLPVSITSFTAKANNNNTTLLNWHTATELNTSYFNVQHSTDGTTFTDLGVVKAVGNGANSYQFTDNSPNSGINYYRLQTIDKDGAKTYSKVVSVQFTVNSNQLTVYPNPAQRVVTIAGNHIASVKVFDNAGRFVSSTILKDATNPSITVSGLPAGVYHLRIQTTDGKVNVVSFVKE